MRTSRSRLLPIASITALMFAVGCGGDDADTGAVPDPAPTTELPTPDGEPAVGALDLISTHDAWVRMPAAGQTVAAAYVTFVNGGEADVLLLSVSSELAMTELHETLADDDGVMRMQERTEGFVIPAGGELVMAPGGAHVMLLGIDPLDMALIDEVDFDFEFDGLGAMSVTAEVRRDMAMPDDHDHDHDHDHGHDHDHDHDHDAMHGASLDADALHALDDELHAGVLEPERQRMVVDAALASLEHTEIPENVDREVFADLLEQLDAALEAGDIDAAKTLAFEVHDMAHMIVPHGHDHGHSHDDDHGHSHDE